MFAIEAPSQTGTTKIAFKKFRIINRGKFHLRTLVLLEKSSLVVCDLIASERLFIIIRNKTPFRCILIVKKRSFDFDLVNKL